MWFKCDVAGQLYVIGYSRKPQMIATKTYERFCKIKQLH